MSDREEGSVHTSPSGSIKETSPELVIEKAPSSTGSIRESRSRSKSPQSQKSNGSKKSPSAAGTATLAKSSTPPRHSRSRSRSTSRRRYRSRSRSHSGGRRRYYYSRSRSRSPRRSRRRSSDRRRSHRSHSRSPMSSRRRHVGDREAPTTSRCLGVFGLSLYTQERDLRDLFSRYGPLDEVQIVHDHQTGRSRGFSFVYFRNLEDAVEARERAIGSEIDGRKIRVDYSITQRAHTPTPGIYLGKPTPGHHEYPPGPRSGSYSGERRSSRTRRSPSRGYRNGGYGRRSPSPYYNNRRRYSRSRSRSRSYSPRKYSGRSYPAYY